MHENVLKAIRLGQEGTEAMPREASDAWWPGIHRENVERAQK